MKNMTRRAFVGTSGLLAATLAACSGNAAPAAEGSAAGSASDEDKLASYGADDATVYWLNFKPEIADLLVDLAKKYEKETGVTVKVETAASGTYEQTLTARMDKEDQAPTLFVIGNQVSVKSWGDFAIDLAGSSIQAEEIDDTYDLYDDSGKLVSQGYCYECYGIIVNKDLIEKAGHTMDELVNFDGLKTVVEDIHSRASELGFDAFTACDMSDDSSWRFTGHMANLEYFYEEKAAGKKWEECPATITGEFLPNYKQLFDLCINNCTVDPGTLSTGGTYANGQEFIDGKAAFDVQGSWQYASYSEAQPNTVMIPYYCGVEGEEQAGLNCGTENCWAVNPGLHGLAGLRCGRLRAARRAARHHALQERRRVHQRLPQRCRDLHFQRQLRHGLGDQLPAGRRRLPQGPRLRAERLLRRPDRRQLGCLPDRLRRRLGQAVREEQQVSPRHNP